MAVEVLNSGAEGIVERRAVDLLERTGVDRVYVFAWAMAALIAAGSILIFIF